MFIDSHCHLDYPDFAADFAAMQERARGAGVGTMLTISTRLAAFPAVRAVAENPHIYCSVGVHPHHAEEEADTTAEMLCHLARDDAKVIGIGETGLDYYYEHSNRAVQKQVFKQHITTAQILQKPIIVHTRDAEEDTVSILQEYYGQQSFLGLIHCFTASQDLATKVLEIGFYISISGIITFKNASDLRETVRTIPLERILIETDSPYLAPLPHRGKRNEPAYVQFVAAELARVYDVSIEEIATQTTQNFHRLFGV